MTGFRSTIAAAFHRRCVDPVGECAKKVHVRGFIPHAIVRVLVNGTQAGIANPYFDSADIAVSPALNLGDTVTATHPLKVLTPKMDDAIDGRRTALYSVQPAYALCPGFRSYRLVFAGRKAIDNPCTGLGQCRHHSLYVQETGGGLRGSSTRISCQPQPEATANLEPSEYPKWLEDQTQALMASFPLAERWGPARKSINIFMVMASLNQFLCDEYKLHRFGYVLEVPLDNTVTKKLRAWGKERNRVRRGQFPTFSIKQLKKADSDQYQELAQACAEERGIPRGRLDIELWEPQRQRRGEQLASQRLK